MKRFVLILTLAAIATLGIVMAKGPGKAVMAGQSQANGAQMGEQIRLRDPARAGDQDRFRLQDHECWYATDPTLSQDQTQDRLQLRDGSCLLDQASDPSTVQPDRNQLRLRDPSLHTDE